MYEFNPLSVLHRELRRKNVSVLQEGNTMAKTWFITGVSKGFGREWAEAALERGDTVAATARNLKTLDTLVDRYGDAVLPLQLDVTDRSTAFETVKRAADHFG